MIDALSGVRRDTEDDMAEAAFDTLAYVRRLKKAGVAEAHADALRAAAARPSRTSEISPRISARPVSIPSMRASMPTGRSPCAIGR